MAQPASLIYTVLPVDLKNGVSIISYISTDLQQAMLEASRLTALNSKQYVILTSTHYTDVLTPTSPVLSDLVKSIV